MLDPELQILAESLSTRCNLQDREKFSVHLDEMTEREAALFAEVPIKGCLCRKETCEGDWFTFEKKPTDSGQVWNAARECIPVQVLMEVAMKGSEQNTDVVERFKRIRPTTISSILRTMGRIQNIDTIAGTAFGLSVAARTLLENLPNTTDSDSNSEDTGDD